MILRDSNTSFQKVPTKSLFPRILLWSTGDIPLWRKVLNFLCGITPPDTDEGHKSSLDISPITEKTKEELAQEAAEFLNEPPFWKS